MEEQLRDLQLKKARIILELEMLSSHSDLFYTKFGKLEADIVLLKKKINREVKNDLED